MRRAVCGAGLGLWASLLLAEPLPFGTGQALGGVPGATSVASADLDGDGDLDLVHASPFTQEGRSQIAWSRNQRGNYLAPRLIFTTGVVERLLAADFDRDGRVDLLLCFAGGGLQWSRGLGPGLLNPGFEARPGIAGAGDAVSAALPVDVTRDGRPDLLVGRATGNLLQYFPFVGGSGSGFGAAVTLPVPADARRIDAVAAADLQRDGVLDVLATARAAAGAPDTRAQLFRLRGLSATSFEAPLTLHAVELPGVVDAVTLDALTAADFERDGAPDLALLQHARQPGGLDQLLTLRNAGDGNFAAPRSLFGSSADFASLLSGDLDRDGDPDLVFTSGSGTRYQDNRRTGFFNDTFLFADTPDARVIALHDDDLDGDPDLFLLRSDGSLLRYPNERVHGRVLLEDCVPRGFSDRHANGIPFDGPFEIASAPDGSVLLAEISAGRLSTLPQRVLSGSGCEQSFVPQSPTPLLGGVGGARALAFVERDPMFEPLFLLGDGELATPAPGNQNRLVSGTLEGGAPPSINASVLSCAAGDDIRGVAIADLDGDGLQEGAYVAEDNDRVAILRGDCPGGEVLVSTAANGVPNAPGSIETADLDRDGDRDLLISARLNDEGAAAGDLVGWYPNAGDATFGALQRIGTVDGAVDARAIDLDRDGDVDVVTAAQGDPLLDPNAGRVLLFRNLGDGTFAPAQPIASGIHAPARASFADLDHDGDLDVLVPSASERARAANRSQCGLSLIEAEPDGSYAAPRCLDLPATTPARHLAGPHSRLALSDVDHDGVEEIFATRIADQQVAGYDPGRPAQFVLRSAPALAPPFVVERRGETCAVALDLAPQGRPGDAALALAGLLVEVEVGLFGDTVAAALLRRDDGDGLAEPAQDALAATLAPNRKGFVTQPLPLIPPPGAIAAIVAQGVPARFWLCVQSGPQRRDRGGVLSFTPAFEDSRGFPVHGLELGDADLTLRSATLFTDGFE